MLGCVAALAGPVTREDAEDGSSAAGLVVTSGSAWWLQASGRLDAPTDEGHEMTLSDDAAGLVLALLRGARAHEAAKSAVSDSPVQPPEASASGVARSPMHEPPAAPLLDGGLVGLLTERQIAFVSEAREWYQLMGERAVDGQAVQPPAEAGPGLAERSRSDRPAREHLIPAWLIEFLRDNRLNLFYACVAGLVLILCFDVARRRAARGSVHSHQKRAKPERREASDRRSGEASAPSERRSGKPRRTLPERRGPEPVAR